jgi:hypothetical protein
MAWAPFAMAAASILPNLFGHKSSTWSGSKPKLKKYETLSKEQKSLQKDILKHPHVSLPKASKDPSYQAGQSYLQSILSQDPEMMKQFEAPYMRQFQEETIPQLAERFTALGGGQNSSAFQQALGQAGASLSERLAALRSGLGLQASQQALGYAQLPFEQAYKGGALDLSRMQLGLGTPAFGYMGMPGTEGVGSKISQGLSSAGSSMGILNMLQSMFGGG